MLDIFFVGEECGRGQGVYTWNTAAISLFFNAKGFLRGVVHEERLRRLDRG